MIGNYFLNLIVPLICIPILIYNNKIANITGLIDTPNIRKTHTKPIPKIGGLYFILVCLIIIFLNINFLNERLLLSMTLLTLGMFTIGLIDDKIEIKGSTRLFLQFFVIAISIIVDFNLNIDILYIGYNNHTIQIFTGSILFSIFCIMALTNAINLADGEDGLITSIFMIFLIIFFLRNQEPMNDFYLSLIFSCLFFLIYNVKGLIFLGNSGSYLVGGLMSFILIQCYNFSFLPIEEIFLLLYLYGIDMLRVYIERILRGIHPFTAEKNHLHHYIFKFSKNKKINLFIYLILLYFPFIVSLTYKNYFILIFLTFSIYLFALFFFKKNGMKTA